MTPGKKLTDAEARARIAVLPGNIVAFRHGRGLTQRAAAQLAGMSAGTWAAVELPGANPSATTLLRVASALGVTIDVLFHLGVDRFPAP